MRRALILGLVCGFAFAGPRANAGEPAADGGGTFRVMTYNIHGGGPVTRGDGGRKLLADYRDGRKMTDVLADALGDLDLDVIALQEAGSRKFVAALAQKMGWNFAYFPGGWQDPQRGWPEGIPAAILTRHKIVAHTNCPLASYDKRPDKLFTRGFGRAVIDTGAEKVTVLVAHLLPTWKNTTHIRTGEITEISAVTRTARAVGESILVLGDMNHRPDAPEYDAWRWGGWTDTFAARGVGDPLTCPAEKPEERIDYVFSSGPITRRLVRTRVLTESPFAMPPGEGDGFALSDHLPVVAEFAAP